MRPKEDGLLHQDRERYWGVWKLTETGWDYVRELGFVDPAADPELAEEAEQLQTPPQELVSHDEEGRPVFAASMRFERSGKLRDHAIEKHKQFNGGRLPCAACGFDFAATYGDAGDGYIECHHVRPLWDGPRKSTSDDLTCLCANCHRVTHRHRALVLSVAAVKEIVARTRALGEGPTDA